MALHGVGNQAAQPKHAEQVQIAQNAVDQAEQALSLAQQPVPESTIAAQQAQVAQAQQQLLKAQQPYTTYDIQQQQHAVAQADAALALHQNPYTDQDVAAAQAQVDQAQAALQQARLSLQQTQVSAPVDGTVQTRFVNPGSLVTPQTPILTLLPPQLQVDATVDASQITSVHVGQPVSLGISAYPNQPFSGTVTTIAPAVDPKTHTATMSIKPDDPNNMLRSGMQAMVNITLVTPNSLVVPRSALVGGAVAGGQSTVVTLEDNKPSRQPVQLGGINDQTAQIVNGVSEGELVVVSGAQ